MSRKEDHRAVRAAQKAMTNVDAIIAKFDSFSDAQKWAYLFNNTSDEINSWGVKVLWQHQAQKVGGTLGAMNLWINETALGPGGSSGYGLDHQFHGEVTLTDAERADRSRLNPD
jgi:hypothetical protein